jgi:hypothetical protein
MALVILQTPKYDYESRPLCLVKNRKNKKFEFYKNGLAYISLIHDNNV